MVMDKETLIIEMSNFLNSISRRYPIKLAYLFGSMARGDNNNMSDIDVAILLEHKYEAMEEAFIIGEIIDLAQAKFNKKVDIVPMEKASVLFKYLIVKDGIVLIDCYERGSIESLIIREYFDFKYYSDIYDEALLSRYKERKGGK